MIHHLHGKGFDPVVGSVHIKELDKLIDKYRDELIITCDDRLISQQLAVDLLDRKGIKAWFFVCHHNVMEQDRQTRERMGEGFYCWFINECQKRVKDFLSQYSFYTYEDRLYRFIRDDKVSGLHEEIMSPLRQPIQYLPLKNIRHHNIGMHTYSHPTNLETMSNHVQGNEWWYCFDWLTFANGIEIESAAYPMGRYNEHTLEIMTTYGVKLGFRSDDLPVANPNDLELPRTDIKNLIWK